MATMAEDDLMSTSPPKDNMMPTSSSPARHAKSPQKEDVVPIKKYEDILKKLKILAVQRNKDREEMKELVKYKEEAEPYMNARHKLRERILSFQKEITDLKKQNRELEQNNEQVELKQSELNDQLEMATLDKEVAEEKLLQNEAEMSRLQERVAELEVNAKMQGATYHSDATENEQQSASVTQMQLQNERLKDALTRLRDLSTESENNNRRRITELEKEVELTADIQDAYDTASKKLEEAEAQVEDLKLQLDDAMGAEDMLEQLTERNLTLSERLDEMRNTIQDLEALKEINDELEESHMESEKQLQEEIDLREYQLREAKQRSLLLEENVIDYENTIKQFRDLVLNLQADIDSMKEQENSQKHQSEALENQQQAILNLNMKLQSTTLKSHIKNIDMDLRKMEAKQAMNQLEIVKAYLPQSFLESDGDAVDALLFFERLASKAGMLSSTIEQMHNISEALNAEVPEVLVTICETRCKLSAFSALSRRFAANLRRCDPETFIKMGHIYRELLNVEKKLDMFIEAVRREELRESDCSREVDMFISQAAHVAETQVGESGLDTAEQQLGQLVTIDMNLDTFCAGIRYTYQTLWKLNEEDVAFEIGSVEDVHEALFQPLWQIFERTRNTKVISQKYHKRVEDLAQSSNFLSVEAAEPLDSLARICHRLGSFCVKLSELISQYVLDLRTTKQQPFELNVFQGILQEATLDLELGNSSTANNKLEVIKEVADDIYNQLSSSFSKASTSDHVIYATYETPWKARIAEIESSSAATIDAQHKILKMNEEMRDLTRDLRTKDQTIQEDAMKIEIMEKRLESVKKQADTLTELEGQLQKAKNQEQTYEEALEALQNDLDKLEQENLRLKQNASNAEKSGNIPGPYSGNTEFITFTGSLETSHLVEQIESLRQSVRFLRAENSLLKSNNLLSKLSPLPTYSQATSLAVPSVDEKYMLDKEEDNNKQESDLKKKLINRRKGPIMDANKRELAAESRKLLNEAISISCSPKVLDLTKITNVEKSKGDDPKRSRSGWTRQGVKPERQMEAQRERIQEFLKKVENFRDQSCDNKIAF